MSVVGSNARDQTISSILNSVKITGTAIKNTGVAVKNSAVKTYTQVSETVAESATPEAGSYFLKVLFFIFMYGFIIFLVLVVVHFTIRPIFSFSPGAPGIISIPGNSTDIIYWNKKVQPAPSSMIPMPNDGLAAYDFVNNFTFSVDLFVGNLTNTGSTTRLILYKTFQPTANAPPLAPAPAPVDSIDNFISYMSENSSMIMYLTDTNDLTVTFFSGVNATNYSCPYIQNVPLFTPFRITVVVEDSLFSVYLNGKQTFQRITPSKISVNSSIPNNSSQQVFFSAPGWANQPTQTIFLQNMHLWNRAITYSEVANASPALALASEFNLPPTLSSKGGTCNS